MKKLLALFLAVAMLMATASFSIAEDLPTITIMFHGSNVTDDTAVIEALNEYVSEQIGANVQVIWGTWGDFDDKAANALISADSSIDMVFTCSWSKNEYNTFATNGYYYMLDDMIAEYGADLVEALPEALMDAATIEGYDGMGVYAVNGYKDFASQYCWDINVTLLEELGYTIEDVEALDFFSFDELFAKAKEVKGDSFYPFNVEPMVLERMVTNSIVVAGDSGALNLLSYYVNPEDVSAEGVYGNTIVSKFETPEYQAYVEKMYEYYQAGYINPALAITETSNDTRTNAQLTADYLIGTQAYALGYEYTASFERGIDVAFIPTTDRYVDTTSSQGAMMAINSASNYPVESFKFLTLLNTDPYVMTLLNYGIEDVHYTTTEEGMIEFTDKRADYSPWRNGMGNITLLPATTDEGATYWDEFEEYYGEASGIPILGYVFDSTSVQNEMAALANVGAQYAMALNAGAVDPATYLPTFIEQLQAAGIETYIAEANAQLDAYMAAK